jgi:hypothetical protein
MLEIPEPYSVLTRTPPLFLSPKIINHPRKMNKTVSIRQVAKPIGTHLQNHTHPY